MKKYRYKTFPISQPALYSWGRFLHPSPPGERGNVREKMFYTNSGFKNG
jgi:hypothetical protein